MPVANLAALSRQNRYDALRMCIGEELCQKLADLKLFMVGWLAEKKKKRKVDPRLIRVRYYDNASHIHLQVGCGAIGCEMLKNYALLGLGTQQGKVLHGSCCIVMFLATVSLTKLLQVCVLHGVCVCYFCR